jgi:hypothetical protein
MKDWIVVRVDAWRSAMLATRGLLASLIGATLLIAIASTAHADDGDRWKQAHLELSAGTRLGGYGVGSLHGFAAGGHLDAGVRRDSLALIGEYELMSVGDDDDPAVAGDPVRGRMHRLGATLRYSAFDFGGGYAPVRGDIWLEGGAGEEWIGWNEGGRLSRRDLSLGFGFQATFKIGDEHPRYIGIYYAMRGLVARAPERKDAGPTCAGPCDEPTLPSPWDIGLFYSDSGSAVTALAA